MSAPPVAGRPVTVAAVDLGASNGRVMVGRVAPGRVDLVEEHRFPNTPVRVGGTLHWDILSLYQGVLDGLRAARSSAGGLDSVGVDSWAVDYGLLDADGRLLGNPVHYRDERTAGAMAAAFQRVPAEELYARTGLQFQPFNTVFQLVAARGDAQYAAARALLLVPDLFGYWLTGSGLDGDAGAELTNASTTGLLDAVTGGWADDLIGRLDLRRDLLPPLRRPGDRLGSLVPAVTAATGLAAGTPVTAVASHDTASAVAGVPARGQRFAYVSCGTWSLVGVELDAPVLTDDSRKANFTNEVGVDGTVRFLRNVMGLWLLQESMRAWEMAGDPGGLLREAAWLPGPGAVVDAGDPEFLPPNDAPGRSPMPERIAAACRRTGQHPPDGPAETVRCIVDSLALAHREAVAEAQRLSGRTVEVVHLVGGGVHNPLLCQLTADACGLPVLAGPVEAGALGNVLVQARALGAVHGRLDDLRALVRSTQRIARYEPRGDGRRWDEAAARLT